MPGLDGVETARRIRADSPLKSVPAIIIITAFGREEVRGEAELAGVNGFLIKPVNQSTLVNALAEIFAPGHCAHELIAALASGCSAPILLCGGKFPEREYSLIRNLENDLLFGRPPMRVLEFSHDPTRQCRVS
jgi:DNA-binding NarL/FixJ family response regulator